MMRYGTVPMPARLKELDDLARGTGYWSQTYLPNLVYYFDLPPYGP